MIIVQSHRTSLEKIRQKFADAIILDVTSRASDQWIRCSPFYPHGDIPVPFSPGWVSASVEGIWQGLKVFERADVDPHKFTITSMKSLKRSAKTYGKVLGHRKGVTGDQLLSYREARSAIYLPTYHWVLEHCLQDLVDLLRQYEQDKTVVLLDYETNTDIHALNRPLSHAGLIKLYIEGNWPSIQTYISSTEQS
jgi:hypothetical protein